MPWLFLALLTAVFESLKDVVSKHNLRTLDEYTVAWALRLFALPFLLPILLFVDLPALTQPFWIALFVSGSLNVVATILYMRAIKQSDLSLTVPMVTFTPLFLLLTSPLIIGEVPSFLGLIGVLLIVVGSYTLNINQRHNGYLAPLKALFKEPGSRLMLLVALIWSVTSNVDKIGVQHSSPIFWAIAVDLFILLAMLPIMLRTAAGSLQSIRSNYRTLLPVGLFAAFVLISQMTAISLTLVAYVIAIKRTSAALSVLFGHFLFKEQGLKERLAGVTIMVAGVILITLS